MTSKHNTPESATEKSFFSLKSVVLTGIMIAFYTLLITADLGGLNTYALAYKSRIGFYAEKIDSFATISSWRQRMFLRHMANYEIPVWLAENKRPTDTILLPPAEYADQFLPMKSIWTDPRVFTYFADFQPIVAYADTARRSSVNAYIALGEKSIAIVRPGGRTNIDSLLSEYERARHQRGSQP